MRSSFLNLTPLLLAPTLLMANFVVSPEKTIAKERQQFTALRRINQEEAVGGKATPPTLALVPGYGLNISFIPTGETIEKIWLDNPQYATLDVDGCLEDLPRDRKCSRPGAQIVHLRRIRDLKFPGLYATGGTLLTVVTNSGSKRNVYTFRIMKGEGTPTYNTVEIVPSSGYSNNISLDDSSISYNTISTGVQVALAQGLIQNRSKLWYRIDNFLLRLQAGTPLPTAAALSGLSEAIVLRLHSLGRGLGVNNAPLSPTPSYQIPQIPNYQNTGYPPTYQTPARPAYRVPSVNQPIPVQTPVYQPPQTPNYPLPPVYQAPVLPTPTYPTYPTPSYPYPWYPTYSTPSRS